MNEFQRDPGGALSSFRYPIKLSGHTKFLRNIGGGLSVINTEVDVEQNAQVLFQECSHLWWRHSNGKKVQDEFALCKDMKCFS